MKIFKIFIFLFLISANNSQAKVNVFACEAELASLTKEIGKDKVKIKQAVKAHEDPHHLRAKPSLLSAITRADLVFCTGLDLEVGWLPIILERGKKSVQYGEIGYFMAGDYSKVLEIPTKIDRSLGDLHEQGNPHVHLNPYNIIKIAKELTKRLSIIDPENKSYYQQNLRYFLGKWSRAIKRWEAKARSLRNKKIIVHHKNWVYLANWLKLDIVANLEPVPGISPTVNHLNSLISLTKDNNVRLIIRTPYENKKASGWLSKKANIKAIELPFTVDNKEIKDLEVLFDNIINDLLKWT